MTTTAYPGIDGHLNFNIPKVKRKLTKDNLTRLEFDSRDAQEILSAVERSYLEPSYSGAWTLHALDVVVNRQLEEAYREKKAELKEEGRYCKELSDQYVFLAYQDQSFLSVVKNGIQTKEKRDKIMNALGNSGSGVSLWKHADVQLSYAEGFPHIVECKMLVFKVVLGRCKAVQPCYGTDTMIEPTPNYDCHISAISAKTGDPFFPKLMKSQIYFYEYTDEALPSDCPRQCLPYAVLTYRRPQNSIPREKLSFAVASSSFSRPVAVRSDQQNAPSVLRDTSSRYLETSRTDVSKTQPLSSQYTSSDSDLRYSTSKESYRRIQRTQPLLRNPPVESELRHSTSNMSASLQVERTQPVLLESSSRDSDRRYSTSIPVQDRRTQAVLPDPVVESDLRHTASDSVTSVQDGNTQLHPSSVDSGQGYISSGTTAHGSSGRIQLMVYEQNVDLDLRYSSSVTAVQAPTGRTQTLSQQSDSDLRYSRTHPLLQNPVERLEQSIDSEVRYSHRPQQSVGADPDIRYARPALAQLPVEGTQALLKEQLLEAGFDQSYRTQRAQAGLVHGVDAVLLEDSRLNPSLVSRTSLLQASSETTGVSKNSGTAEGNFSLQRLRQDPRIARRLNGSARQVQVSQGVASALSQYFGSNHSGSFEGGVNNGLHLSGYSSSGESSHPLGQRVDRPPETPDQLILTPTHPQQVDLGRVQNVLTDSQMLMLKQAVSSSQTGGVVQRPNPPDPSGSSWQRHEGWGNRATVVNATPNIQTQPSVVSRRPSTSKQKLSLASYREMKRRGTGVSATASVGTHGVMYSDSPSDFSEGENVVQQQPKRVDVPDESINDSPAQLRYDPSLCPPPLISADQKPKGILKNSNQQNISGIGNNSINSQQGMNNVCLTDPAERTKALSCPGSPNSVMSTTSSVCSSVSSSLVGSVVHSPAQADPTPAKKKKKVNRNMIGYKKRRRRKTKKAKASSKLKNEASDETTQGRTDEQITFSSPLHDSDIEYNDFSFEQPPVFEASVPDASASLTRSLPMEGFGIRHWSEALNSPRFQPKVCIDRIEIPGKAAYGSTASMEAEGFNLKHLVDSVGSFYRETPGGDLPEGAKVSVNSGLQRPISMKEDLCARAGVEQTREDSLGSPAKSPQHERPDTQSKLNNGSSGDSDGMSSHPEQNVTSTSIYDVGDIDAVIDRDMRQSSTAHLFPILPNKPACKTQDMPKLPEIPHSHPRNQYVTYDSGKEVSMECIQRIAASIHPFMKGSGQDSSPAMSLNEISSTIAAILVPDSESMVPAGLQETLGENVIEREIYEPSVSMLQDERQDYQEQCTVLGGVLSPVDESSNDHAASDTLYSAYHPQQSGGVAAPESAEQTAAKWLGQMEQLCKAKNISDEKQKDFLAEIRKTVNLDVPLETTSHQRAPRDSIFLERGISSADRSQSPPLTLQTNLSYLEDSCVSSGGAQLEKINIEDILLLSGMQQNHEPGKDQVLSSSPGKKNPETNVYHMSRQVESSSQTPQESTTAGISGRKDILRWFEDMINQSRQTSERQSSSSSRSPYQSDRYSRSRDFSESPRQRLDRGYRRHSRSFSRSPSRESDRYRRYPSDSPRYERKRRHSDSRSPSSSPGRGRPRWSKRSRSRSISPRYRGGRRRRDSRSLSQSPVRSGRNRDRSRSDSSRYQTERRYSRQSRSFSRSPSSGSRQSWRRRRSRSPSYSPRRNSDRRYSRRSLSPSSSTLSERDRYSRGGRSASNSPRRVRRNTRDRSYSRSPKRFSRNKRFPSRSPSLTSERGRTQNSDNFSDGPGRLHERSHGPIGTDLHRAHPEDLNLPTDNAQLQISERRFEPTSDSSAVNNMLTCVPKETVDHGRQRGEKYAGNADHTRFEDLVPLRMEKLPHASGLRPNITDQGILLSDQIRECQDIDKVKGQCPKRHFELKSLDDLDDERARLLSELSSLKNTDSDSAGVSPHGLGSSRAGSELRITLPQNSRAMSSQEERPVIRQCAPDSPTFQNSTFMQVDLLDTRGSKTPDVECNFSPPPAISPVSGVAASWGAIIANSDQEKLEVPRRGGSTSATAQLKEKSPMKAAEVGETDAFAIECQAALTKVENLKSKREQQRELALHSAPINVWLTLFLPRKSKVYNDILSRICFSLSLRPATKFSTLTKGQRKTTKKTAERLVKLANNMKGSSCYEISIAPGPKTPGAKTISQWLSNCLNPQTPFFKDVLQEVCAAAGMSEHSKMPVASSKAYPKIVQCLEFCNKLLKQLTGVDSKSTPSATGTENQPSTVGSSNNAQRTHVNGSTEDAKQKNETPVKTDKARLNLVQCSTCKRYPEVLGVYFIVKSLEQINDLVKKANEYFQEYVQHMKILPWNASTFKTVKCNMDKALVMLGTMNSLSGAVKKHVVNLNPAYENVARVVKMSKLGTFKRQKAHIDGAIQYLTDALLLLQRALFDVTKCHSYAGDQDISKMEDYSSCQECRKYVEGVVQTEKAPDFISLSTKKSSEDLISLEESRKPEILPGSASHQMTPDITQNKTPTETVPDRILKAFQDMESELRQTGLCDWVGSGKYEKLPDQLLLTVEIKNSVLYGGMCMYLKQNLRKDDADRLFHYMNELRDISECQARSPHWKEFEKDKRRVLNFRWSLLNNYSLKLTRARTFALRKEASLLQECLVWHGKTNCPSLQQYQTEAMANLINTYLGRMDTAIQLTEAGVAKLLEREQENNMEVIDEAEGNVWGGNNDEVWDSNPGELETKSRSHDLGAQRSQRFSSNEPSLMTRNMDVISQSVIEQSSDRMLDGDNVEPRNDDTRRALAEVRFSDIQRDTRPVFVSSSHTDDMRCTLTSGPGTRRDRDMRRDQYMDFTSDDVSWSSKEFVSDQWGDQSVGLLRGKHVPDMRQMSTNHGYTYQNQAQFRDTVFRNGDDVGTQGCQPSYRPRQTGFGMQYRR